MNKTMVDPPEGWRYGFPKVWDQAEQPDFTEFLRESGYPEERLELALKWSRHWPVETD